MLAAVTAGPAALASGAVLPALWAACGDPRERRRGRSARSPAPTSSAASLGALVDGLPGDPSPRGAGPVPARGRRLRGAGRRSRPVARSRLVRLAYAALLAIAAARSAARAADALALRARRLRATLEGASGIVTVVDAGDDLQLRLDNYYVLGGSAAERSERRQGLLPLLLHPEPRRVAFVGLATGITASAAPALGVADTTRHRAGAGSRDDGRDLLRLLERPRSRRPRRSPRDRRRPALSGRYAVSASTSSCRTCSSRGTRARAASTRARCTRPSRAASSRAGSSASGCRSTS